MSSITQTGPNITNIVRVLNELKGPGGKVLAEKIATATAPVLTSQMDASFNAGQTVYGEGRPLGKGGRALSLVQSGKTRTALIFSSAGTQVTVTLTDKYQGVLVGKYGILPSGRQKLPESWIADLKRVANETIDANLTKAVA